MKNNVTEEAIKSLQDLTKQDPDTEKYVQASKLGRNIFIGMLIILFGILYSVIGLYQTIVSFLFGFILLIIISIILYFIAKYT